MRKIIVDTMAADGGAKPIVLGALRALAENKEIALVLVGNTKEIIPIMQAEQADTARIELVHTTEFVSQHDAPTCVFNGAENTSMVLALQQLKTRNDAAGLISAGNTGALLVGSICRLGLLEGIKIPALATALPCRKNGEYICLVDCGANTDCTAEDLKCFAVMGNAFMQSFSGLKQPKIGLLSVGRESEKGTALTKAAYALLKKLPIQFIGNVEGDALVGSDADVIVADGFTGNILLKNTEATGLAALETVRRFGENTPAFHAVEQALLQQFDFNNRGGAIFLGVKKPIVKMHGCATEDTAYACTNQVLQLDSHQFSDRITTAIHEML